MDIKELKKTIEEYISQEKDSQELFLVDISCSSTNVVEVIVDAMEGISLERCANLSRYIEDRFDREVEDYELTVASASISEPFKINIQFIKNIDREVEVVMNNGDKLYGILTQANAQTFTLEYEKKVLEEGKKRKVTKEFSDEFSYEDVKSVKLVIKF